MTDTPTDQREIVATLENGTVIRIVYPKDTGYEDALAKAVEREGSKVKHKGRVRKPHAAQL